MKGRGATFVTVDFEIRLHRYALSIAVLCLTVAGQGPSYGDIVLFGEIAWGNSLNTLRRRRPERSVRIHQTQIFP